MNTCIIFHNVYCFISFVFLLDIGLVKLECRTKTSTGVNFTVSGTSNNDTGRVNASLETKYVIKDYGNF